MNRSDTAIVRALRGARRTVEQIFWRTYGMFLDLPQMPASPASLLFVCKGNICRSPFAEALGRKQVPEGLSIDCHSAGLEVGISEMCPQETVEAAERFGIDLSAHSSRRIDAGLVAGADMVLAMEVWQAGRLRKSFPEHKDKIFLLPLFEESPVPRHDADHLLNIHDPYGRPLEDFIACFKRIDACLKGIFSGIRDGGIRISNKEPRVDDDRDRPRE